MLLKSRSWGFKSRVLGIRPCLLYVEVRLLHHGLTSLSLPSPSHTCEVALFSQSAPSSSSSSSWHTLRSSLVLSNSSSSSSSWHTMRSSFVFSNSSSSFSSSWTPSSVMPSLSWSPSSSTFTSRLPSSLSSLRRSASLSLPSALLASVDPADLQKSSYLQNAGLRHLCKYGTLQDACALFARMDKDLFSWNIMMSEYAGLERSDEVFLLFDQMQNEGTVPNKFIFATILSACATHEEIGPGKRIHARIEMIKGGFTIDPVVQTALVNMYGRFSELEIARQIFRGESGQDVVLWNAILTVYTQHGYGKVSWLFYSHMRQLGVLPNKITCIIMLSVCSSEAALKDGKKLHAWVMANGLEDNIVVGTALINMYSKCSSLDITYAIFDRMVHRDLILWNAMISGHALNRMCEEAFQFFSQMQQEGVLPNEVTCTSVLDACASPSALRKGKLVHARILGMGLEKESIASAALVNMYGKSGSPNAAFDLFNKSGSCQDAVSWNTMISAYAKHGMYGRALQLYNRMEREGIVADRVTFISILSLLARETDLDECRRVHNHVTCRGLDLDPSVGNVLVSVYGQCGSLPEALVMFYRVSCQDAVTFVNVITACATQAVLAEGRRIHSFIEGTEMEHNVVLGNALVNMYNKCGSLVDAQRMFQRMPNQNVVSWSTIIAAYAQHGEGKKAFLLFTQMCKRCIVPDSVTLASLLVACSHAGILNEAFDFFHFVGNTYNILALDHFNCMIDLLGRSGWLDYAEHLVNFMPVLPNSLSWSMLVCACHIHADMDRGYLATEYALELDSDDTTVYVLLSNMYGAFGKDS